MPSATTKMARHEFSWLPLLEQFAAMSPRAQAIFTACVDPEWLKLVDAWLDGGPLPPPEPPYVPPERPKPTPEQNFARWTCEVLRRAEAWARWHADRADKRCLPRGRDNLERVAAMLRMLQDAVGGRGISGSTKWITAILFRSTMEAAEREWADNGFREYARDQVCEIETSHMRTLLRTTINEIADRRWQLAEGYMDQAEAQLAAAEDLAFAPQCPKHGG